MVKIKLKTTVLVYKQFNKITTVRFNSELINFEDDEGEVYYFLKLLDEFKTEKEIKNQFLERYNGKGENEISQYFETLKDLNLIESQVFSEEILGEYEFNRWSRNFEFFNTLIPYGGNKFEIQKKTCIIESMSARLWRFREPYTF